MQFVDFDGMRTSIWRSMNDVIDSAEYLLAEYKDNDNEDSSSVDIDKDDLLRLFESINELRSNIGGLMCIKKESLGFGDLVHLLRRNYLDIDGNNENDDS